MHQRLTMLALAGLLSWSGTFTCAQDVTTPSASCACENASPEKGTPTLWSWLFIKDEGYQRRKDFCIFAFGSAGRFLHPNDYRPLPPLPPPLKP